jgi:hypothetical protein
LEGLGDHLTEIPSLQIEVSLIGIYEDQVNYQDVLRAVHERGYRLTGCFQWRAIPLFRSLRLMLCCCASGDAHEPVDDADR